MQTAAGPDPVIVILAGGLGTRLGGVDKALLPLGNSTMLGHVLARLAGQARHIAINANGDAARFARFGLTVLPDPVAGRPGPLAGILAGMLWAAEHTQAPDLVTVPADCPFIPRDLVTRLLAARAKENADLALAASLGRIHPVVGLWPASLATPLRHALEHEALSRVTAFTARYRAAVASFEAADIDPFFNVNRPEDWEKAERQAVLF